MTTIEDVLNARGYSPLALLTRERVRWFRMGFNRGLALGMVMGGLLVAFGYHGYFMLFVR